MQYWGKTFDREMISITNNSKFSVFFNIFKLNQVTFFSFSSYLKGSCLTEDMYFLLFNYKIGRIGGQDDNFIWL